jgi:hypothetical protein
MFRWLLSGLLASALILGGATQSFAGEFGGKNHPGKVGGKHGKGKKHKHHKKGKGKGKKAAA